MCILEKSKVKVEEKTGAVNIKFLFMYVVL